MIISHIHFCFIWYLQNGARLIFVTHIPKTPVIKLNYSKKDLAERLGIQRSSLSRELNKMRRDGLLEYDAKTITLKNIEVENVESIKW